MMTQYQSITIDRADRVLLGMSISFPRRMQEHGALAPRVGEGVPR